MNEVTVSIVSYCQKDLLNKCLANIRILSLPDSWQIVVVDNNSSDRSADMVAQYYPKVKLLRLKKNIGYAGGHNVAYTETSSPIFVVLNPDVIVLSGSLEILIRMFEKFSKAAIVGPCLLNPDGSLQFSARRFYTWRTVVYRRLPLPGRKKIDDYHLMKDCELNQSFSVDWVLGAAMAVRRSAFPDETLQFFHLLQRPGFHSFKSYYHCFYPALIVKKHPVYACFTMVAIAFSKGSAMVYDIVLIGPGNVNNRMMSRTGSYIRVLFKYGTNTCKGSKW